MKKQGALPMFCNILENVRSSDHERLKGDISLDPVYSFLTEVSDSLAGIATEQYELISDPNVEEHEQGENFDVYMSTKENFLNDLMFSISERVGNKDICVDWSDSAKINTSDRYDYLAGLAKLSGEERTEAIKEFVKGFPSYPWEKFYWPNEK